MCPVLRFSLFDRLAHAVSTRHGGVSTGRYQSLNLGFSTADAEDAVIANRERLLNTVGRPTLGVVNGWLTHGKAVSIFRADRPDDWPILKTSMRSGSTYETRVFASDAVVSNVAGLGFVLTFADCVPLLFFDHRLGALGIAHAGWRGTAQGIAAEVMTVMRDEFGCAAADISAAVGPSVGPCCYSVGAGVTETFVANGQTASVEERDGVPFLDLWASNETQLVNAGVRPDAIENPRLCTSCHTDTFYSHRAEHGSTGRFGLIAAL